MPHCVIEYSDNIQDQPDWKQLMTDVHSELDKSDLFNTNDIKSRVIRHEMYLIGDGDPMRAFVTINIQILSGRNEDIKEKISNSILSVVETYFPISLEKNIFSITIQINDINSNCYKRKINYE